MGYEGFDCMRVPEDKLVLSAHADNDVIVVAGIGYFAQSHTPSRCTV